MITLPYHILIGLTGEDFSFTYNLIILTYMDIGGKDIQIVSEAREEEDVEFISSELAKGQGFGLSFEHPGDMTTRTCENPLINSLQQYKLIGLLSL